MKRSPIPAANALARADGLGLRRHAIEKKSPRKGTKTELSFAQMSPYVSREDPREGGETYLTW